MCSSIRYAGRAISCLPSIVAMGALAMYGLWERDVVGALLTPLAVVAIAVDASTVGFVRRYLDRVAARVARAETIASRLARASAAGPARRLQLEVLTSVVGEAGEHDRALAEHLELDHLLERFAERCVDLRSNDRALCALRNSRYRSRVLSRHIVIDEELDAISEFIYLIAATAALPPDVPPGDVAERVLGLLTSSGEGRAERSQPPPSASTSATADVIC